MPTSFIANDGGLPRTCFGEPGQQPEAMFVASFGMCQVCAKHCPVLTEPQPARSWRMACGRNACALCYQFEKTRNVARKLRTNTVHHYHVMKQLELLELYTKALVEADPSLQQQVIPSPPLRPPLLTPSQDIINRESLSRMPEKRRSISRPRSPQQHISSSSSYFWSLPATRPSPALWSPPATRPSPSLWSPPVGESGVRTWYKRSSTGTEIAELQPGSPNSDVVEYGSEAAYWGSRPNSDGGNEASDGVPQASDGAPLGSHDV